MISKAKSIRGSGKAIDYILNDKGQAIELDRNGLVGTNGNEILQELRMVQAENTACHNNTISIVLSPDSKQGDYTQEQMREFLHKHLDNLGLKDNQWIATIHNSTDDKHIHVIANRVDFNGKALNDSFISKRAQESAQKIAKQYGFKTAKELGLEREVRTKDMKKEINHFLIDSKAKSKTFDEFCDRIKEKGFEVKPSYNKQGVMFGMRIEGQGESFKLSEINRNIKHYHLADIMPKDTLIKATELAKDIPTKTNNNAITDAFSNLFKAPLSDEAKGILKAMDIAKDLKLEKLVINSAIQIVKGFSVSRGMSL